ncbi:hypothetical protein [Enterobacter sp. R1(2018)]|uniref:hypothetical protein n=1 Tax=Enterobacter sp. R1(2018) TaxID=2447891 RepID=UPI000EB51593|nr:hypothetical protein [Enterobacter sp. R1(2018)]RKQ40726.1 hypothetical protein D8M09_05990 [Enterobacter sp. R1(2018)]
MKKSLLLSAGLVFISSSVLAQNITVDVPDGYKIAVVPTSVSVPQAINIVSAAPQTLYVAPAPVYHPRARHAASVAEGMIIEHQYDDRH